MRSHTQPGLTRWSRNGCVVTAPLSALIWLAMAAVYLPLVPAAAMLLTPALSAGNWQRLFDDPQIPQALAATLVSTLIATLGALFIALIFVSTLWPVSAGVGLCTRLPWLLAFPTLLSPPACC
ncbi:putative thiamine transport system permease [Enterobacter cloacae]|uniref:Putative thiamine transport system permease n=1 Tax=Enterobacter cloacae TaxID=550 RepID=A0A377M3R2_ENTCL|nr:putative thiamine transport system permease [Enterobacter cloacae]